MIFLGSTFIYTAFISAHTITLKELRFTLDDCGSK